MAWDNPSVEKRKLYIRAMKSRPRALTSGEFGELIGVHPCTALQMLYALERDGVVARQPGGGKNIGWLLTGKPLPEKFSSTAEKRYTEPPSRFNFAPLAGAFRLLPQCLPSEADDAR